jgi:hypothetical protein
VHHKRALTLLEEINAEKQKLRDRDDPIKFMPEVELNLTRTTSQLDQVERRLNLHYLEFTKLQLYHSIEDNARSRRNNLIFYGLADMRNENCLEVLTEFLSDWLGTDLERMYIQRVHRLGLCEVKME